MEAGAGAGAGAEAGPATGVGARACAFAAWAVASDSEPFPTLAALARLRGASCAASAPADPMVADLASGIGAWAGGGSVGAAAGDSARGLRGARLAAAGASASAPSGPDATADAPVSVASATALVRRRAFGFSAVAAAGTWPASVFIASFSAFIIHFFVIPASRGVNLGCGRRVEMGGVMCRPGVQPQGPR